YIPIPERPVDKPFLMPIEDVFSISGRGTVVTGRGAQGEVKVSGEIEGVGVRATVKRVVTGGEMVKELLDERVAGGDGGVRGRGEGEGGGGAGAGGVEAGEHHAAHEVQGGGVHPDEGGGGAAHAVLQRVPAAVLLPDDGRDGGVDAAVGGGDGDAGGQRESGG